MIKQIKMENKCRIDSKMTAQQEIKNAKEGWNTEKNKTNMKVSMEQGNAK